MSDKTHRRLCDLLALSRVPRWSIVPVLSPQSVADHTFRVAVIYTELCAKLDQPVSVQSLLYILLHDGVESRTADIPGPFKRNHLDADSLRQAELAACPWVADAPVIMEREKALIKAADLIETFTYVQRWGVGTHASLVAGRIHRELTDHCKETNLDPQVMLWLCNRINTDDGRIEGMW